MSEVTFDLEIHAEEISDTSVENAQKTAQKVRDLLLEQLGLAASVEIVYHD